MRYALIVASVLCLCSCQFYPAEEVRECTPGYSYLDDCAPADCCPDMPQCGFFDGRVESFPERNGVWASLAVVEGREIFSQTSPAYLAETETIGASMYRTDCMDLSDIEGDLFIKSDDVGFDGPQGELYPTISKATTIESDADRTCLFEAPDIFALKMRNVEVLASHPDREGIIQDGFAMVRLAYPHGPGVPGVVLKHDGVPLEPSAQVFYPGFDGLDLTNAYQHYRSTTENGIAVITGIQEPATITAEKDGDILGQLTVEILPGHCFIQVLRPWN